MKKISKHLVSLALLAFLALPMLALPAAAQTSVDPFGMGEVDNGVGTTLKSGDPRTMAGKIINVALTFLALIAVVIVLLGGFKWMTAAGNEDKVSEAKQLLGAGVVGLVIILAAWALAGFVINSLWEATNV